MFSYKHYSNKNHISNLITSSYYKNLICLRNVVENGCDQYFQKQNSPKIDLFLITKGVSSPMGKGSDSLPVPISLSNQEAFLVDSAQFGMEPLVQKNFDMVYCYLPSFRGEDADDCHLNQFYHCEAELRGTYIDTIKVVNELVKNLIKETLSAYIDGKISFKKHNFKEIERCLEKEFPVVSLDEVDELFERNKIIDGIEIRSYGKVLTRKGEIELARLITDNTLPVWVTKYYRDTVPFYQKPDPVNTNRTLNADLIFPSINNGFGGEIVGAGQRQDSIPELYESIKRQEIKNVNGYGWYIDLRRDKNYKSTSGFGLGVERFIAWMLGLSSIVDACIYPVLKNEEIR